MRREPIDRAAFWHREFGAFFEWCAPRLSEVVDAAGVRELWLQGEAYRYFRRHRRERLLVSANCHNRNDLACYEREDSAFPVMASEIKLYGLRYLAKNLTGYSDLRPYTQPRGRRARFVFTPKTAASCHPKEGSILRDYRKLLEQRAAGTKLCLLLLVLDVRGDATRFGEAITRVDFGGPGRDVFTSKDLLVRSWTVG